jgi:lipopolysaccharide transport system permease protein
MSATAFTPPAEAGQAPSSSAPAPPVPHLRLQPRAGWIPINFAELWHYRELLGFFAARDVKVRYKQTALGIVWAVIQPLLMMLLFWVLANRVAGIGSDEKTPYAPFIYVALLPWQLFVYALTQASNSLVANERLITKIYFPRLIVPIAATLSGLVDFAIAAALLVPMLIYYHFTAGLTPSWAIITLPIFILFALIAALAVGLWLSALNVQYRDIRHTIPFLTQFWFFATPVIYPLTNVKPAWRAIYGLNPMVGVVEGFRWALLGHGQPPGPEILVSAFVTLLLFVGGLFYFRRMEKNFADVL